MEAHVAAVHRSRGHTFTKPTVDAVELVGGVGIVGDAHAGATVRHRSRVARDPTQPNLRQVHLIHGGLLDELAAKGFDVAPGALGENVTTRHLDLLALARRTRLRLGPHAVIEITGLRNPCAQLDALQPGLRAAVLDRDEHGSLVRKAGVMAIVITSGRVATRDAITVVSTPSVHVPLEPL